MNTLLTGDSLVEDAATSIRRVARDMDFGKDAAPAEAAQAEPAATPAQEPELEGKDRKITLTLGGH